MLALLKKCLFALALSAVGLPGAGAVQQEGGVAEAKLVGDHLLVLVTLRNEGFVKETHLLVDYLSPNALELHENVFGSVEDYWAEGETHLHVSGESLFFAVSKEELILLPPDSADVEGIGARHDRELKNVDISGVIGLGVLKRYGLRVDLENSKATFYPSGEESLAAARRDFSRTVTGVKLDTGTVLVPVDMKEGGPAFMQLNSRGYHTYVHPSASGASFSFPGGAPVSAMTALRPAGDGRLPGAEVLLQSGWSLLQGYTFQIDPVAGYLALRQIVPSRMDASEAEFYNLAEASDLAGLTGWLAANPQSRHVIEAAELAFDLGFRSGMSIESQLSLLETVRGAHKANYAPQYLAEKCNELYAREDKADLLPLIFAVCDRAMDYVSEAQNPLFKTMTLTNLGNIKMDEGEPREAWKYFIAASFKGHRSMRILLVENLGRAYFEMGRYRRAYSSYKRAYQMFASNGAAATEDPRGQAILKQFSDKMDLIRQHLDPEDPLLQEGL